MTSRAVVFFLMLAALCFAGRFESSYAAAGEAPVGSADPAAPNGGHHPHHGHPFIQFILSHATDLSLTDDEKTKLLDLEKSLPEHQAPAAKPEAASGDGEKEKEKLKEHMGEVREKVEAILTKDQIEKLKELMKERRQKKEASNPPASK